MDNTLLYQAMSVGKEITEQDDILREVWQEEEENFSGLAAVEAQNICEDAYEKQGADVYNQCYAAATSCGNDSTCDTIAKKYAKALGKGWQGTFEQFKTRSSNVDVLTNFGLNALGTWLSGGSQGGQQPSGGSTVVYAGGGDSGKSNTGMYVGLGVLALVGIGAAIYFGGKK
jgi:hypothetical protein